MLTRDKKLQRPNGICSDNVQQLSSLPLASVLSALETSAVMRIDD